MNADNQQQLTSNGKQRPMSFNQVLLHNKDPRKVYPKYKTELCKTFMQKKSCPYGFKCLFAHGESELIKSNHCANYKTFICKSFFQNGYCPYGYRCNFKHYDFEERKITLPYYYISLFIMYDISNPKPLKRLPIFQQICNSNKENNKENFYFDFNNNFYSQKTLVNSREESESSSTNEEFN